MKIRAAVAHKPDAPLAMGFDLMARGEAVRTVIVY
jgi:Zn-dependent alcohol dehydrogenase